MENNEKLAKVLINYSIHLKKGEKVLIEARGIDCDLVNYLVREAYKVGALPIVDMIDNRVQREILHGMNEKQAKNLAKYGAYRMRDMDEYIGIRGGQNSFEASDVPSEKTQIYDRIYSHPVHHELRVKKTKWVVLRYPTEGMAAQAKMSTAAFSEYYYNVCTLDYGKMDRAMDAMSALFARTDKVRIVSPNGTDLSFSVKDIGSKKCSGHCNIPDGEIYTAPVKTSVNGVIKYNAPSIENGIEFKNVKLTFKDGKIIDADCDNGKDVINGIFDTDEGARYVGEFAIGVNPFITKPMGDILFDEKIAGSIHFTPGCCYDDCDNGNQSAIHWDLVLIQTPEYGGGEIYFDDV
ncbi:MAG: aminopeptidase, partial [Christensenellaceae bacterium]|nr:aminopeptidase [Christensenellaceae bacterium]